MFNDANGWTIIHHEIAFEADQGRPLVQFVAERPIICLENDLVDRADKKLQ
jgi:hypothetical protein